jgi:hypothetical protein
MEHLQGLIELDQRAGMQMSALAATLKQVIAQMDAILEDADQSVSEILTDLTTGLETKFTLNREPVKIGSVKLYLNSTVVATAGYTVAGNVITPVAAIPAGKILRADYIVLGLKTQTTELLAGMDDLKATYFTARRAKYSAAAAWIEANV